MKTKKRKKKKNPRRRRAKAPIRALKRRKRTKSGKRAGRKGGVKKTSKKRVKKVARKRRVVRKMAARRPVFKGTTQKPVYALDTGFEFFYELRDLILKSSPAERDKMIERLNKIGRIKLAITSGIFINKENLDPLITDLLIVGDDIDRRKLRAFLKATEAEVGKEVKFTVMDKEEFQYRLAMFDRFIRVLLESPHEKLINRIGI